MAQENHDNQAQPSQNEATSKPRKGNPRIRIIIVLALVVIVLACGLYWFLTRNNIETDDAYTDGRKISMAPHVNGYVTGLFVNDNQFVHAGDLLIKIDDRDYRAALQKAEGQLLEAQANLRASSARFEVAKFQFPGVLAQAQGNLKSARAQQVKAEADYRRQSIVSRQATSQQDIDYAKAALDQARAQVVEAEGRLQQAMPVIPSINNTQEVISQEQALLKAAEADVVQAKLNLGWTELRAPHDGWVSQRNVEQGNYVQQGQQIFTIVQPEIWVTANYKETQLTRMKAGQDVDMKVDAYPSLKLRGHVDSLQLGSGEQFSTFPAENATGNFVKIVQRIPVKILIDSGIDPQHPLAIGLSVEPTVHVQ
ncbi:HlyD family secretion protein [Acetobacter oeni]|uniref:Multidrug export protein EmrA n=1 Tax=Acetobacter oeni TaxID=304077 RepID=A0A511XKS3_9PROT|nr:HlyD family secretion protein [Acetobacter oeni]MBB3883786.1 membrane fusion protein (multidrug efflux system) [Acetobacter oeni]NHO19869.1 biotin/lipoyl-binding protein [Acetobacter oeni]GBR10404.1 multidrug ABC transporter [Acetobacter oeni LMG 21952]GEN63541.1 multidrug export protein EmrA [Acetobacter oeni]